MIGQGKLDKLANIFRQTPSNELPGEIVVTVVGIKIHCSLYGGAGYQSDGQGGSFARPYSLYVVDFSGREILSGLKVGDMLDVLGDQTYIVRGYKAFQNNRVGGRGVMYTCDNCEVTTPLNYVDAGNTFDTLGATFNVLS